MIVLGESLTKLPLLGDVIVSFDEDRLVTPWRRTKREVRRTSVKRPKPCTVTLWAPRLTPKRWE